MSIDDKMFTAEDINMTHAVHKCCKLIYPSFLQYKDKGKIKDRETLISSISPFSYSPVQDAVFNPSQWYWQD